MIKLWIYENHICELQSEKLNEGWSSQLHTQLLQLWKEEKCWFRNCKRCVYNCDDHSSFNSSLCSSHIWFSYIHNFTGMWTLRSPNWIVLVRWKVTTRPSSLDATSQWVRKPLGSNVLHKGTIFAKWAIRKKANKKAKDSVQDWASCCKCNTLEIPSKRSGVTRGTLHSMCKALRAIPSKVKERRKCLLQGNSEPENKWNSLTPTSNCEQKVGYWYDLKTEHKSK